MKAKPARASASSRRASRPATNSRTIVINADQALALVAKAPPIPNIPDDQIDLSDIPETNFARPNAKRGKYHKQFLAATGIVQLAPDVRRAFADEASVNRALRMVIDLAKGLHKQE
jgi:hypothetical protein